LALNKKLYNKLIIGKKGLVPQRQFIMEQWKEGTHMRKTILHMEEKNEKLINEKLINEKLINEKLINEKHIKEKHINEKLINEKLIKLKNQRGFN
jgi:hypothetical protein